MFENLNTCGGERKPVIWFFVDCHLCLPKMMRKLFVVWFDRSRSARARAKQSRDMSRQHFCKARARARTGPGLRTPNPDSSKRPALALHKTQDQAVLKEQSNSVFIDAYYHTWQCFLRDRLFHQQPAKKHWHIPRFFQAPREGISEEPCKNALLLPCTEHLKNTAKKRPHRPQFFQNHFKDLQGISKEPCKIHRCSCTGHPKTTAKNAMNKTGLLETHLCHHQAAKNTRADHDLSRTPPRNI